MNAAAEPWSVTHLDLDVELAPERVLVHNVTQVVPGDGEPGPLVFDGIGLELLEVTVDGQPVTPTEHTDRTLTLDLAPGRAHTVTTRVAVAPRPTGSKGIVAGPGLLHTNLEPQGFRRVTYALDRPNQRATVDITLTAEPAEYPVLLANGVSVAGGTHADGRIWRQFSDPVPLPSYLLAFVGGDLRTASRPHTTRSGRSIDLRIVAPPDLIDGAEFALTTLDEVMTFDEAHGGIEHDLDTLTFVAVPGYPDATEYHGLMFFDPALLVEDRRGVVDDDLLTIVANVAHEYGHHTRGNRVTVASWGELALKEGLTVLTAQNDVRAHRFGPVGRVLDVLDLRRLQFPEEVTIGAPVHRGEVDDPTALYTRTTYLKGAEVWGMLRRVLGPERWTAAFATFLERYDLSSARIDDLVALLRDLAPDRAEEIDGIARWFGVAGRPALSVTVDREGGDRGDLTIEFRRTDARAEEPPVAVPVELGFLDADGRPATIELDGVTTVGTHLTVLRGRTHRLQVRAESRVVVSALRGYTAPVDLAVEVPADELAHVLVHEDDAFARWWSGQELMIRAVDAHRAGRTADSAELLDVAGVALRSVIRSDAEPMLLAQLLAVPDEFSLGDREPIIDVDGVSGGLDLVRRTLGVALHDELLAVLTRHADEPTGRTPSDFAARSLVEPVLALALASGSTEARLAASRQLESPNPTRATRALAQLAHLEDVPLDELLASTAERWSGAPRLVDRWLRAQSGSRRADTVARVATLAAGPLYDRDDRGRVMAIWFPFATRNRSVFHDPSGEGYRIFVDELLHLLAANAGLAVRLVGDLLQFQRFDPHRRELLRAQLERIAEAPGLPPFATAIVRQLLDD
jgi:aminopeptidase N